jgi:hypothetical protein
MDIIKGGNELIKFTQVLADVLFCFLLFGLMFMMMSL